MLKKCKECGSEKPLDSFYKDSAFASGYMAKCKICRDKKTQLWRERNREKYNSDMRKYQKENRLQMRLYRYKLTPEDYQRMITEQNNACLICKKIPGKTRPLAIDHCHNTKKVRGLLCYGCNRALHILESEELLKSALAYLASHSKPS